MRALVAISLGLLFTPSGLFADAASKDAKIEQVLVLVKAGTMNAVGQIFSAFQPQFEKISQSLVQLANIPEPERKAASADLVAKLTDALKEFASWEKMKPALKEAYSDTYTEEELDGLLLFFNSPIGQTYLAKSVVVSAKTNDLEAKRQQEFTYIVQGIARDWVAQHQAPVPSK